MYGLKRTLPKKTQLINRNCCFEVSFSHFMAINEKENFFFQIGWLFTNSLNRRPIEPIILINSNWYSPNWNPVQKKNTTQNLFGKWFVLRVCVFVFAKIKSKHRIVNEFSDTRKKSRQAMIYSFNLPEVMIESFFDDARIQKLIDFGNASEVHSNVTFCPIAAPTNWFCIIIIGGTV